jgi:1-acyl-sn-glycerol-3-phosphate acyltransferase
VARIEFYRNQLAAAALWAMDAFPVDRFGVPVRAIRTAVARAASGRVVGLFPDGGVVRGTASVCRGAPMKRGACVVANRAGVPIIPCVILGTHQLNRFTAWLPLRRTKLWVIFGQAIHPRADLPRRRARDAMAAEVQQAFVSLYAELRSRYGIDDAEIP